jgi:hypothetical protein
LIWKTLCYLVQCTLIRYLHCFTCLGSCFVSLSFGAATLEELPLALGCLLLKRLPAVGFISTYSIDMVMFETYTFALTISSTSLCSPSAT